MSFPTFVGIYVDARRGLCKPKLEALFARYGAVERYEWGPSSCVVYYEREQAATDAYDRLADYHSHYHFVTI